MFQFTHPGRGATLKTGYSLYEVCVSIHAPREGCDPAVGATMSNEMVSIHAPREGCDSSSLVPHTA